jgi:hypothetical protein
MSEAEWVRVKVSLFCVLIICFDTNQGEPFQARIDRLVYH